MTDLPQLPNIRSPGYCRSVEPTPGAQHLTGHFALNCIDVVLGTLSSRNKTMPFPARIYDGCRADDVDPNTAAA